MVTSVVLHRVSDYDAWRKVYEAFGDAQREGGVVAPSVHRAVDDPDNVLVLHPFATLAEAQAFFSSPELLGAMREAGVDGEPRLESYENA